MPQTQIEWVRGATGNPQIFRRMVVGWQTVLLSLNATVLSFNDEYLKSEGEKAKNRDHGMREIAVKKLVIGSLFELRDRLDEWYRELEALGALSDASKSKKIEVRTILKQVAKFDDVRNNAFHFGDPVDETGHLLDVYDQVEGTSINLLNMVLHSLVDLGERLKLDAADRCE